MKHGLAMSNGTACAPWLNIWFTPRAGGGWPIPACWRTVRGAPGLSQDPL